jgi:hypothetical protein
MTSEARAFLNAFTMALGGLLPVAACVFAAFKGGRPERYGSFLYAAAVLATMALELITGQATPVTEELFFDTALASGFLWLAIRFNNLWLGAAMMIMGLQLAVHATHLTDGEDPILGGVNLYAALLNLFALLMFGILISGTVASIRQRARRRREERVQAATDRPRRRPLPNIELVGG